MRALMKMKNGKNAIEIVDIDEPAVSRDLVKIRVKYCGICGSDLHAYHGTYPGTKPPVVLGHEFSGEVVEIGPHVTRIKIGDRVTSETTYSTCNNCIQCITKNYNLCSTRKGLGTQVNGAMADYVLSREESLHIIPENVSYLSAALTEPLACGVHAVLEKVTIHSGETICIFGPGTIGLLAGQVAKSQGAEVIMTGVSKDIHRLKLAKQLGFHTINQEDEDVESLVRTLTDSVGVDKCIECSGAIEALNTAIKITKKRGDIVQMGVFSNDYNIIDTQSILQKELNYIGSRSQKPSSWVKTIELLGEEIIQPENIVSSIISLDEWEKGFQSLDDSKEIKIVFDLSK